MTEEIREKISDEVAEIYNDWANGDSCDLGELTDAIADFVLAMPEIADGQRALDFLASIPPPESTPFIQSGNTSD